MGQGGRGAEKEKINKWNSFSFRWNERNEILECGHNHFIPFFLKFTSLPFTFLLRSQDKFYPCFDSSFFEKRKKKKASTSVAAQREIRAEIS